MSGATEHGTIERARGRWPEILRRLGVEERFLVKRKGPCPSCGGKDRFRFDDREEGWHFCNACGPGPGLVLLRKVHGWDFKTACAEVDKIIGKEPPPPRPEPRRQTGNAKAVAINRLLAVASDQGIVDNFLSSRGLTIGSPILSGLRRCQYFDDDGVLVGSFPAVLVPILAPDGTVVSAQRVWHRADVGEADKKPLPPVVEGALMGAAARLFDCDDVLGIAEGVWTAMSARELFDVPCWSVLSAGGMRAFNPPASVTRLIIFGDNDRSFAGQAAAYALANRLATRPTPIEVVVYIPDTPGTDWNDELRRRAAP